MNRLEQWFLERTIRKQVRSGGHAARITALYQMINTACEQEFTEDNIPTLNDSLVVWFLDSLKKV